MKKIASLVMAAMLSVTALAANYTGELIVSVNDSESSQSATISLEKASNGTYSFVLKNFILEAGNQKMGVGNIELTGLTGTTSNGITTVEYTDSVTITAGDDTSVTTWLGPLLGKVPLELVAKFNDTALMVGITIDMQATLGQEIDVSFVGSAPAKETGDLNADGTLNTTDVAELVNRILKQ